MIFLENAEIIQQKFMAVAGGYLFLTLQNGSLIEIVKVQQWPGMLFIFRAQEGTKARSWPAGTKVLCAATETSFMMLYTPRFSIPVETGDGYSRFGYAYTLDQEVDPRASMQISVGTAASSTGGYACPDYIEGVAEEGYTDANGLFCYLASSAVVMNRDYVEPVLSVVLDIDYLTAQSVSDIAPAVGYSLRLPKVVSASCNGRALGDFAIELIKVVKAESSDETIFTASTEGIHCVSEGTATLTVIFALHGVECVQEMDVLVSPAAAAPSASPLVATLKVDTGASCVKPFDASRNLVRMSMPESASGSLVCLVNGCSIKLVADGTPTIQETTLYLDNLPAGEHGVRVYQIGGATNCKINFSGTTSGNEWDGSSSVKSIDAWGAWSGAIWVWGSYFEQVPASLSTSITNISLGGELFNQNISGWDVSRLSDFSRMFYGADIFNQNISGWDVSNATNMDEMFSGASEFDQDLSGWKPMITSVPTDFARRCPMPAAHYPTWGSTPVNPVDPDFPENQIVTYLNNCPITDLYKGGNLVWGTDQYAINKSGKCLSRVDSGSNYSDVDNALLARLISAGAVTGYCS
jgi:surface protein